MKKTKIAEIKPWEVVVEPSNNPNIEEAYKDNRLDGPWVRINETVLEKELNDQDRISLLRNSRHKYYKSAEGRSLIESAKHYIIGKGIVYRADDENPIVQEMIDKFWNHPRNMMELRQKEIILRSLRDGEAFVRFFTDDKTGESYLRFIEPEQIDKIITDENDIETPVSYLRKWTPANSAEQEEETIDAEDIVHVKPSADMDMLRGRPYLEASIRRIEQFEQFLEGRVIKNRIASGFVLEKILKGPGATAAQVSSKTNSMSDARKESGDTSVASKKMPKFGSMVVHNEAIEYKWCEPHINADDSTEDGRLIKLSIVAGVNAPEYLLSDASNANYASTMVAENPYVRSMEDYQDTFQVYFQIIFRKVIERLIAKRIISSTSTETVVKERAILRNIIPKRFKKLREVLVDKAEVKPVPTKTFVTIEFPPMIHKELKADSEAYQIHSAMGWASDATLSSKLGYDYDKEQEEIAKQKELMKQEEEPEEVFNKDRQDAMDEVPPEEE